MPDISTVAVSVGVTLGLQTIYYLVMKFPDQMHRTSTTLFELNILENTTFLVSELALTESIKAFDTYTIWRKNLYIFATENTGSEADKPLFLEQLSSLNAQVGRLRACASSYDLSGVSDLVTVHISLLEQARLITKNVALNIDEKFSLDSSLADLDAIESQLPMLVGRIRLESNVRDLQYQTRMETVRADTKDAMRRWFVSSLFLVGAIFALQFPVIDLLTKYHPSQKRFIHWTAILVPVLCWAIAVLAQRYLTQQAMKEAKKLGDKAKTRNEQTKVVFKQFAEKLGHTRDQDLS